MRSLAFTMKEYIVEPSIMFSMPLKATNPHSAIISASKQHCYNAVISMAFSLQEVAVHRIIVKFRSAYKQNNTSRGMQGTCPASYCPMSINLIFIPYVHRPGLGFKCRVSVITSANTPFRPERIISTTDFLAGSSR
ncbi:jg3123 [Pararge aegeria aegeria]|uniref:Jg3123 protein n=1 Tax=Pararge aegeria aegeria TaxID=348720 RepID=A0A8S4RC63_9NEOP|nr:jg3123 [Pararge aegeria aegeria]